MNARGTYCNPLPLPDYPRGVLTYPPKPEASYRETADPSVIYEDGKWYLYSSGHMAYKSEDFIHWEHCPIDPENIGYAPTVVKHKGQFILMANIFASPTGDNPIYSAPTPLGPFTHLGALKDKNGNIFKVTDPMLFSDDDGQLYLYYGGGADGIYGVKLDPDDPTQIVSDPVNLIRFRPENTWECLGEWNEDKSNSWLEGGWMYKHNGVYYLTYCAPGTEFASYAMGAYTSDQPLGGFKPQKNNPFAFKNAGLIRGSGHGCVVDGPNGTIWAFYTSICNFLHSFERIIGMDEVVIDENGELSCKVTEIPQPTPGTHENPGLIPLTFRRDASATSSAPGREPIYGLDDSVLTWWQPDRNDPAPVYSVNLRVPFTVCASRLLWREVGLDYQKGVLPEPIRYVIQGFRPDTGEWVTLVDESKNTRDMKIDYQTFEPVVIDKARLLLTPHKGEFQPGLISFTLFGAQE